MKKKFKFLFFSLLFIGLLTFIGCGKKEVSPKYYKVTFLNSDEVVLYQEEILEGTTPAYKGDTPTIARTDENTKLVFDHWDKTLKPIYEDTTYTAVYVSEAKYKVVFKNYDGTVLETKYVFKGDSVTYDGDTPKRNSETYNNISYSYNFYGWSESLACVTQDMEVTACFSESALPLNYNKVTESMRNNVNHYGQTDSAGSRYYVVNSSSNSASKITISYGIDNKGLYMGVDLSLTQSYESCTLRMYLPSTYRGQYRFNFVYVSLGSTLNKGILDGYVYSEWYTSDANLDFISFEGNVQRRTCEDLCNLAFQLLLTAYNNTSNISIRDLGFFKFQ